MQGLCYNGLQNITINANYSCVGLNDTNINSVDYEATNYLPNVTEVSIGNTCGALTSCIGSTCVINPTEGANASLAVRVTAIDTDNDCDTQIPVDFPD